MNKLTLFISFILFSFVFSSCDPFPPEYELTGIECDFFPDKEHYSVNENISLSCNLIPDFSAFSHYKIRISVWNAKISQTSTTSSDAIEIYNEENINIVNQDIILDSGYIKDDSDKIYLTFNLKPVQVGEYTILISIIPAFIKPADGYYYFYKEKHLLITS